MFADLFYLFLKREEILERRGLVIRVSQQGGGVQGSHKENSALFNELTVLNRYLEILGNQAFRGYSAEADHDFGADKPRLLAQPVDTVILLLFARIPVFGRAAFNHIGDIDILMPVEIYMLKVFVEKLTASADERLALHILVVAWAFADKHNLRLFVSDSENEIGPCIGERASAAGAAVFFE
jgi:hypothetical protein